MRLHAANNSVIASVFYGETPVDKSWDDDFVVVVGRHAESKAGNLSRFDQEFIRGLVPNAYRDRGLGQFGVRGGFKAGNGQFVSGVFTVSVLTANDQVLEHRIATEALCGCFVTNFVNIVELDPQAVEQFLGALFGQTPTGKIAFVVRIHVLVETHG